MQKTTISTSNIILAVFLLSFVASIIDLYLHRHSITYYPALHSIASRHRYY